MKTATFIIAVLLSTAVLAQAPKPTTGYARVNGVKMYYETHGSGSGEPVSVAARFVHDDYGQLGRLDRRIVEDP
jgi:hypothetical protein